MTPHAANLLELLSRYVPADALEAAHRAKIVELLALPGDPLHRNHFTPGHLTASAFIIHRPTATLLLHRHRRLGRWLQMGGHLDEREPPLDAALREGIEESGLSDLSFVTDAILDLDVHSIPAGKGEPAHAHYDVRWLLETRQPHLIAAHPDESDDLRWFPLAEAIEAMQEEGSTRVVGKIASRLGVPL